MPEAIRNLQRKLKAGVCDNFAFLVGSC